MNPQIITFPETKCIGKRLTMSFANYRVFELWSSFMPRRNQIKNTLNSNLFNVQINPKDFSFDPNELFEKWAVVPVEDFSELPNDMETLVIEEGLYAVFNFKGNHTTIAQFFNQIYTEWLPSSGYQLDNRPQFEILGYKYKNNDPNSEEEIWIPIKI
jgi:AraC family transcriptional regulator